jgi:hypothetical protein
VGGGQGQDRQRDAGGCGTAKEPKWHGSIGFQRSYPWRACGRKCLTPVTGFQTLSGAHLFPQSVSDSDWRCVLGFPPENFHVPEFCGNGSPARQSPRVQGRSLGGLGCGPGCGLGCCGGRQNPLIR